MRIEYSTPDVANKIIELVDGALQPDGRRPLRQAGGRLQDQANTEDAVNDG